jgi:hypothetical protein
LYGGDDVNTFEKPVCIYLSYMTYLNIFRAMENLNPLDVLKEELDTDEVTQKINAIHKLRIVATLLGPEGIRNTLLPYLDSKYSLTQP